MASENRYENFEEDAVKLIRYFAWRLATGNVGFSEDDQDDIEQELAVHLWRRVGRYDETRGAARKTFMSIIISNCAKSLIYKRRAQKRDHRLAESLSEEKLDLLDDLIFDEDEFGQRLDIMRAVRRLAPIQRDLWEALASDTVSDIARDRGVHRSTIYDQRDRLRDVLREVGLDAYAPDPTDRDPSE